MGRWAQQRRRGGGPGAAAALPRAISATDDGAGQLSIVFDRPITVVAFTSPDNTSLVIDGNPDPVTSAGQTGANTVQVDQGLDPSGGSTITWDLQPTFISTPIDLSTSVLVT